MSNVNQFPRNCHDYIRIVLTLFDTYRNVNQTRKSIGSNVNKADPPPESTQHPLVNLCAHNFMRQVRDHFNTARSRRSLTRASHRRESFSSSSQKYRTNLTKDCHKCDSRRTFRPALFYCTALLLSILHFCKCSIIPVQHLLYCTIIPVQYVL